MLPRRPGARRAAARATPEPPWAARGAFAVALIGRLSDWKGQDVLARALAGRGSTTSGRRLVAGDAWPGQERVERNAATRRVLGLGDRFRLLGFREDIDTVLGAADAVVVPSTRPEPLRPRRSRPRRPGCRWWPRARRTAGDRPQRRDRPARAPGRPGALAAALRRLADDPLRSPAWARPRRATSRERFGARPDARARSRPSTSACSAGLKTATEPATAATPTSPANRRGTYVGHPHPVAQSNSRNAAIAPPSRPPICPPIEMFGTVNVISRLSPIQNPRPLSIGLIPRLRMTTKAAPINPNTAPEAPTVGASARAEARRTSRRAATRSR